MYFVKKILKFHVIISVLITSILVVLCPTVYATSSTYVIPGGDAIGLKIDTGIFVAGKYQVNGKNNKISPWINSDIEEGDRILSCNGITVYKISDLNRLINNTNNNIVILQILRANETINTNINVVETLNGERTIGLYVKDRLIGIGTLTFIDPENYTFASLGHGISDKALSYGSISGEVVSSNIEGIKKGVPGVSGEKKATITNLKLGSIEKNNLTGVYGKVDKLIDRKQVKLANQTDVKKGKAKILTVIEGNKIEEFEIEIIGINLQDSTNVKGIKYKVIDKRLVDKTGGIVQGMSGSPIIQNDLLLGAVSHVSVEDPTIGYGMHIEWMYEESKKLI